MPVIVKELNVKATVDAMHDAVTTPEGLRGWWSKDCDIGAGPGEENVLRFDKGGQKITMRFRIDKQDPAEVAWTCIDNGNPAWIGTTLRFEITPDGDGASVAIRHEGFEVPDDHPAFKMTAQGWEHFAGSLGRFVESGEGQPW